MRLEIQQDLNSEVEGDDGLTSMDDDDSALKVSLPRNLLNESSNVVTPAKIQVQPAARLLSKYNILFNHFYVYIVIEALQTL